MIQWIQKNKGLLAASSAVLSLGFLTFGLFPPVLGTMATIQFFGRAPLLFLGSFSPILGAAVGATILAVAAITFGMAAKSLWNGLKTIVRHYQKKSNPLVRIKNDVDEASAHVPFSDRPGHDLETSTKKNTYVRLLDKDSELGRQPAQGFTKVQEVRVETQVAQDNLHQDDLHEVAAQNDRVNRMFLNSTENVAALENTEHYSITKFPAL